MKLFDPRTIELKRNAEGYLDLIIGRTRYSTISCKQLFPVTDPGNFIEITAQKDGELQRLGIIKKVSELPNALQVLIREEISLNYFVPEILRIHSARTIKGDGLEVWAAQTDKGDKTITFKPGKETVLQHEMGTLFIIDTEACRYKISTIKNFPLKCRETLEKYVL